MDSKERNKGLARRKWGQWILALFITGGVVSAIIEFLLPKIWRENQSPIAQVNVSTSEAAVFESIVFDGVSSSDPEGHRVSLHMENRW